jgi:predicted GNAT family acetyltransferase
MDPSERDGPLEIRDNAKRRRFEADVDGGLAFVDYDRKPGKLILLHTEVPERLRGHGLATDLVRAVIQRADAEGLTIVPICPFVKDYLKKQGKA